MPFLANVIYVIHLLFVIFTIIIPFIKIDKKYRIIYTLHITWCISLLVHWYLNNDSCGLTVLEGILTNKKIDEGFIYKIVSPIYKITSCEIRYFTVLLLLISFFKLTV